MSSPVTLQTENDSIVLRQFTTPREDIELFGLIEKNRQYWWDISRQYPDIEDVRASRVFAEFEAELCFGIRRGESLLGWLSLITYDKGDRFGNWAGVWVDKDHTRAGLATTALRTAVNYIRDNPEHNRLITTTTREDNIGARKALERAGFEYRAGKGINYHPGELVYECVVG